MIKLNIKLVIVVIIIFGVTAFMSCEKKEVQSEIEETELGSDKNMSLKEFIESVETDEEKSFFAEHEILDNRKSASKSMNNKRLKSVAKPKISFRWGGNGCTRPIGICLIIPIGRASANAEAFVADSKYIIIPDSEDNGITSDSYLPIYEDLYVDENTTIKAGVYTAYYDEQKGKYAVALDIK